MVFGSAIEKRSRAVGFKKAAAEFLIFSGLGGLLGAGVGLFMFLSLGVPPNPEDAGYASGLFLISGIKLGALAWIIPCIPQAKKGIESAPVVLTPRCAEALNTMQPELPAARLPS
jgi:hypothetical protein